MTQKFKVLLALSASRVLCIGSHFIVRSGQLPQRTVFGRNLRQIHPDSRLNMKVQYRFSKKS